MAESRIDNSKAPSAARGVARGVAQGAVVVGIEIGLVDRLLMISSLLVLIPGAIVIGVAAFVVTAVPLALITSAFSPTGGLASALGIAWFVGFLLVAGLGIRRFVQTVGRRVIAISERAAVAVDTFAGVGGEEPAPAARPASERPTLAELDARFAPRPAQSGPGNGPDGERDRRT